MRKTFILILLGLLCSVGMSWGADVTKALSDVTTFTSTTSEWTYSSVKLQNNTVYVEVPTSTVAGTVAFKGSGTDTGRLLYIYKTNGTVKDETRSMQYQNSYQSVSFTSSDIKTVGEKYYLVFSTTHDWKAVATKVTITSPLVSVTYKANGGSGDDIAASAIFAAPNTFSYGGHTFVGWNTQSDGNGASYVVGDVITSATNLFAQWASYTVTYDANGGSGTMSPSSNEILDCTFTPPAIGERFIGWNTAADGSGDEYQPGDDVTSDLDLFALWETLSEYRTVINAAITTNLPTGSTKDGITYNYNGSEYSDATGIKLNDNSADYLHISTGSLGSIFKVVINVKVGKQSASNGIKYGFVASGESVSTTKNNMSTSFEEVTLKPNETCTNFKIMRNGTAVYIKEITVYYYPSCHILNLTAGKWASFCPTIGVSIPEGVTAYKGAISGTDVILTPIGQSNIPAGVGVILKANATNSYTFSSTTATAIDGNSLMGTIQRKARDGEKTTYALSTINDEQLFYTYVGGYIPANKAYFETSAVFAPGYRIVEGDNNATSIDNFESSEDGIKFIQNGKLFIKKNGVVYDMMGTIVK